MQLKDLKALSPGVGLGRAALISKSAQCQTVQKPSLQLPELLEEPVGRQDKDITLHKKKSKIRDEDPDVHKKMRFFYVLSLLFTDTFFIAFLGFLAWACTLLVGVFTGFDHHVIKDKIAFLWDLSSWGHIIFLGGGSYFFYYLVFYTTVGTPLSKLLLKRR
ncbi:MAG: hypothetical protein AB8C84_05900 [Oligoflexales bacterium]